MVRLTNGPDMAIAVYSGRNATPTQQQQQSYSEFTGMNRISASIDQTDYEVITLFSCSAQLSMKFNAYKYGHIKKFSIFQALLSPECYLACS